MYTGQVLTHANWRDLKHNDQIRNELVVSNLPFILRPSRTSEKVNVFAVTWINLSSLSKPAKLCHQRIEVTDEGKVIDAIDPTKNYLTFSILEESLNIRCKSFKFQQTALEIEASKYYTSPSGKLFMNIVRVDIGSYSACTSNHAVNFTISSLGHIILENMTTFTSVEVFISQLERDYRKQIPTIHLQMIKRTRYWCEDKTIYRSRENHISYLKEKKQKFLFRPSSIEAEYVFTISGFSEENGKVKGKSIRIKINNEGQFVNAINPSAIFPTLALLINVMNEHFLSPEEMKSLGSIDIATNSAVLNLS